MMMFSFPSPYSYHKPIVDRKNTHKKYLENKRCMYDIKSLLRLKSENAARDSAVNDRLQIIYHEKPRDYSNDADYDICKRQLLTLLDYIYSLDRVKFKKFKEYKDNLSDNLWYADKYWLCTLRATKRLIEDALLQIEKHREQVNFDDIQAFEVNACLPGAAVNMFYLVRLFYPPTLNHLLVEAKLKILNQSAIEYIRKNMSYCKALEVHVVSALLNSVEYGLPAIDDPYVNNLDISLERYCDFSKHCENVLTLPAILDYIIDKIPAPKGSDLEYDSIRAFYEQIEGIPKDPLDVENNNYWQSLYVYDKNRNRFVSKDNEEWYRCQLIRTLEKKGLIRGYVHEIDGLTLIFNGKKCYWVDRAHEEGDNVVGTTFREFDPCFIDYIKKNAHELSQKFGDLGHFVYNLSLESCIESDLISDLGVMVHFLMRRQKNEDNDFNMARYIRKNSEIVESLTEDKYDIYSEKRELIDRAPLLSIAAGYGWLHTVEALLEGDADVSKTSDQGESPLFAAALHNQLEVLKRLLRKGAHVDQSDESGKTPLFAAAAFDYTEIVNELILNGANVNTANKKGESALHIAAHNGHFKIVKLLIQQGANAHQLTKNGLRPIDLAQQKKHRTLKNFLCIEMDKQKNKFPTSYFKLTHHNGLTSLERAKILLNDYTKNNNCLIRFFTFHWCRNFVRQTHQIVQCIESGEIRTIEALNDRVDNELIKLVDFGEDSSLARRIAFIQSQIISPLFCTKPEEKKVIHDFSLF